MGAFKSCQEKTNGHKSIRSFNTGSLEVQQSPPPSKICKPRDQIVLLQYIKPVPEEQDEFNLQLIMSNYQSAQECYTRSNHRRNHDSQIKVTRIKKSRFCKDGNKQIQSDQLFREINLSTQSKSHHNIKNSSLQDHSPKSILKKPRWKKVKSCSEISKLKQVHFQTTLINNEMQNMRFHYSFL